MKNLLLLFAGLLCMYLYLHPRVETQVETRVETKVVKVPVTPVAAPAVPTPPKVYYHSPLDAPPMPNYANTGAGYYSTDPTVHPSGPHLSTSSAASSYPYASSGYGVSPYYYPNGYGTGSVSNTIIYNVRPTATAAPVPTPLPRAYVVPPSSRSSGGTPLMRRPQNTGTASGGVVQPTAE